MAEDLWRMDEYYSTREFAIVLRKAYRRTSNYVQRTTAHMVSIATAVPLFYS